jgi:hypothetical protein
MPGRGRKAGRNGYSYFILVRLCFQKRFTIIANGNEVNDDQFRKDEGLPELEARGWIPES